MKIDVLPIQMCPEKMTFNKHMDIKALLGSKRLDEGST